MDSRIKIKVDFSGLIMEVGVSILVLMDSRIKIHSNCMAIVF